MISIVSGIKNMGILLIAYRVYLMALPEKPDCRKRMTGGVLMALIGASMVFLYQWLVPMHFPVLLAAFFLVTGMLFGERIRRNLPLTLISYALSYSFYYLTIAMLIFGLSGLSYLVAERFGSPVAAMNRFAYLTSVHPVGSVLIILAGGIGGVPNGICNSAGCVCPHIHKGYPAEELYQAYLPEC